MITLTVSVDGEDHRIEDVPPEAWRRFVENAKRHFPKAGEDAWAHYLSEVVVAGAGGDDETVSYFMTGVPIDLARAVHSLLGQVEFRSWEEFHAYLLRAAGRPGHVRLVNFRHPDGGRDTGTFVATGLDPVVFAKIEEATGKTFEQVLGTFFAAARDGRIEFSADTTFIDPVPAGQ